VPAKLTLHPPQRASRFLILSDAETLVVGRDPDCGLVIEDARISRHHAQLRWAGAGWVLEDMGSKNGTCVNGAAAAGQELCHGDWISLGGLLGRFERIDEAEAATQRQERLARLHTTALTQRRLMAQQDAFDMLLCFLQSAMELSGAERGFVLVSDADGRLHVEVAHGFTAVDVETRFAGSRGAVTQALESGASVIASDAQADPFLGGRPSVVAQSLGAVACVPLQHEGHVIGALYVDSPRPGAGFTELDVEILESLARHAGLALAGMRLERRIRRLLGPAESPVLDALERQIGTLPPPRAPDPSSPD